MKFKILFALFMNFTCAYSFAQTPDFSEGSRGLEPALQNTAFAKLFDASIYATTQKIGYFRFVVSPEGLLCPQRILRAGAKPEFFSSALSNSGCISISSLARQSSVSAKFKSDSNPIPAQVDGELEIPGKELHVSAKVIHIFEETPSSFDRMIQFEFSAKITKKKFGAIWISGSSALQFRLRKIESQPWQLAHEESANYYPFEHALCFLDINMVKAGWEMLTGKGSFERPLQVHADRIEYQ